MDLIEQLQEYLKAHPEVLKRVLVVILILGVGVPLVWWQVRASEEKAYVLFTNGYYYYKNQNVSQALGALQQLVTSYPGSKFAPMGQYYLGLTYLLAAKNEEASDQFRRFMEANGDHFLRDRVYTLWMAAEMAAGHLESAVQLADKFLVEFDTGVPSSPEVLYRKGVALDELGRREESAKCFETAAGFAKAGSIFGNLAFYARTSRPI